MNIQFEFFSVIKWEGAVRFLHQIISIPANYISINSIIQNPGNAGLQIIENLRKKKKMEMNER